MSYEIIDFHCHPFVCDYERIGMYPEIVNMKTEDFFNHMADAKVCKCAGSVIGGKCESFDDIHNLNLHALELRNNYPDTYIPGIHIHPDFIDESIREIDFAAKNGVKIIGELVPYQHGWNNYSSHGFLEILSYLNGKEMIVSLHIGNVREIEQIEIAIKKYKDIVFVLAHPGYNERLSKHIDVLKKYENTYLDLSGGGIECYGTLKKLTDCIKSDKLLFGTDFPVTAVNVCVAAVLSENISDDAKENILSKNAKRLLKI